jgi:hypothetical protein
MNDDSTVKVRTVVATIVILLSVVFVHLWCAVEMNILTKGKVCLGGDLIEPLPGITLVYFTKYGWGYFLAVLPAVSILPRRVFRSNGPFLAEIILHVAYMLTLIWTMGCLVAWRVPYMRIHSAIGG